MTSEETKPLIGRPPIKFEDNYAACPMSGCWIWMAGLSRGGYGACTGTNGRSAQAHRFSYERYVGPIPPGLCVCHRCDVRPCVNPAHLFVGTHADNNEDRDRKGRTRQPTGEQHGMAKLTRRQAEEIRRIYRVGFRTQKEISIQFGISRSQVATITLGKQWIAR